MSPPKFALAIALKEPTATDVSWICDRYSWLTESGGVLLLKPSNAITRTASQGVHIIKGPDGSLCTAWNSVLKYITDANVLDEKDYLAFAGTDDEVFQPFVESLLADGDFDVFFGDYVKKYGAFRRTVRVPEAPSLFGRQSRSFDVAHPGLAIRWARYLGRRFDETLALSGDFDLIVSMQTERSITFRKLPQIQVAFSGEGMSNRLSAMHIYAREWLYMKTKHGGQSIRVPRTRFRFYTAIVRSERLHTLLRHARWLLSNEKN